MVQMNPRTRGLTIIRFYPGTHRGPFGGPLGTHRGPITYTDEEFCVRKILTPPHTSSHQRARGLPEKRARAHHTFAYRVAHDGGHIEDPGTVALDGDGRRSILV